MSTAEVLWHLAKYAGSRQAIIESLRRSSNGSHSTTRSTRQPALATVDGEVGLTATLPTGLETVGMYLIIFTPVALLGMAPAERRGEIASPPAPYG